MGAKISLEASTQVTELRAHKIWGGTAATRKCLEAPSKRKWTATYSRIPIASDTLTPPPRFLRWLLAFYSTFVLFNLNQHAGNILD